MTTVTGRLFVVATPIGNLADVSERARAVLGRVDRVACEDTRRTGRLLEAIGVEARLVSLHEHNERRRVPSLLAAMEGGETIALVSDAGTPLISDPGFVLVREAVDHGLEVEAIPGPSAVLVALVVSALPPLPFTFAGFPPPKSGRRQTFYGRFAELDHTLIFFETPHRIERSLEDAVEVLGGDRPSVLCRELTKMHEEVLRGSLRELREAIAERASVKGEMVLVVGARPKPLAAE